MAPNIIKELESDRFRRNRESAWVCCLSKFYDSLLTWSYYNSHKGVCVGLDLEKVNKYLNASFGKVVDSYAHEVQYRDIIEKPDYFRDEKDFFNYQMCTKTKDWEQEQEVHMFIFDTASWYISLLPNQNDKDGPIDWKTVRAFPKIGGECFESLYLGVNIDKKEKDK